MPGITGSAETSKTSTGSKYDAIPGPLGLASASLEGKVALVTGAGMFSVELSIQSLRSCIVPGLERPIGEVASGHPHLQSGRLHLP